MTEAGGSEGASLEGCCLQRSAFRDREVHSMASCAVTVVTSLMQMLALCDTGGVAHRLNLDSWPALCCRAAATLDRYRSEVWKSSSCCVRSLVM